MSKRKDSASLSTEQGAMTSMESMEIHSAEMQEVIGRMPHWIISWGITLIFVVIAILLVGSWFFTYPDVVTTTITLTTQNPPISVSASSNGKLQSLLVKNGQKVAKGEYLAVLENAAALPQVLNLKKLIPLLREFLGNFELNKNIDLERQPILGEMQNSYEVFLKNYADYLKSEKLLPKNGRQKNKLRLELKLNFNNLLEAIGRWESKYALRSPEKGIIAFTRFWSNTQNIQVGDKVFMVRPEETGEWIGQSPLPARDSGKVKEGQKVRVKLDDFNYMIFGYLRGKIRSRSLLPVDNKYILEICFPWGLKTTKKKTLDLNQGMNGQLEIITENKRFLERILSTFKEIF